MLISSGNAQAPEPQYDATGHPILQVGEPFEKIAIDSLAPAAKGSSRPAVINGYLLKAKGAGGAPGAVLHPACEGLLTDDGQVKLKYARMGRYLNAGGFTVLLVDGFNPRGFREACTDQKTKELDPITRLKDILGGLAYLRSRGDVLGDKIIMMTWGAAGSLEGMNKATPYYQPLGTGFAGAVMFYPQCDNQDKRFAPYAPIQVFVGEKDAWNPARHCLALVKRQEAGSAPFTVKTYPETLHSFDGPVAPRSTTPNPRIGTVMVGNNPGSTTDAYRATREFLAKILRPPQ